MAKWSTKSSVTALANFVFQGHVSGGPSRNAPISLLDERFAAASHSHAFADITSKPTTLAGYGITDAAAASHSHAWGSITSRPTNLVTLGSLANAAGVLTNDGAGNLSWETAAGGGLEVGVTTIASGATGSLLYDSGGTLAELAVNSTIFDALDNAPDASGGLLTYGLIGTSGTKLGLLNTANTFGALQTFPAAVTGAASLNIPHGTAPTSPNNGDVWTTTAAMFVRINGTTQTLATLGANTFTAAQTINAGTLTTAAQSLAQTWNSGSTVCRGHEITITDTASAAGSTPFRIRGGASGTTHLFSVDKSGWLNGISGATMVIAPASGQNLALYPTAGGNVQFYTPLALSDNGHMSLGTSSGVKIGTATTQKLAFWNATPVVQQVLATGAGATVDNVITLLQTLGLCRQS